MQTILETRPNKSTNVRSVMDKEEAMLLKMREMLNRLWTHLNPLPDWQDLRIRLTDQEVAEELSYGRE